MFLLGLSAALLAVVVLLVWGVVELRQHAAAFREHADGADAHRRAVEGLLEPEHLSLIEPTYPMETCALCRGPIGKRRETDRMWRRVKRSRVEHYHEACWAKKNLQPDPVDDRRRP